MVNGHPHFYYSFGFPRKFNSYNVNFAIFKLKVTMGTMAHNDNLKERYHFEVYPFTIKTYCLPSQRLRASHCGLEWYIVYEAENNDVVLCTRCMFHISGHSRNWASVVTCSVPRLAYQTVYTNVEMILFYIIHKIVMKIHHSLLPSNIHERGTFKSFDSVI